MNKNSKAAIHVVVLCLHDSWSNCNLKMLVFEEIREPEREKPLGAINEDNQHEFPSERSELFRPQSGQPSDEESNEGLF